MDGSGSLVLRDMGDVKTKQDEVLEVGGPRP